MEDSRKRKAGGDGVATPCPGLPDGLPQGGGCVSVNPATNTLTVQVPQCNMVNGTDHTPGGSGADTAGQPSHVPQQQMSPQGNNALARDVQQLMDMVGTITSTLGTVVPIVRDLQGRGPASSRGSISGAQTPYSDISDDDKPDSSSGDESDDLPDIPSQKKAKLDATQQVLDSLAGMSRSKSVTGPPLDDKLVERVSAILELGMDKEVKDTLLAKAKRPANFDRLEVVPLNKELTGSKDFKNEDFHLQRVQKALLVGIGGVMGVMDAMLKASKRENQELLTPLSEAIGMLADASHGIDVKRRSAFLPCVREDYRTLCTDMDRPVKTFLFGENLGTTVKDLSESMKVKKNLYKERRPPQKRASRYPQNRDFLSHAPRGGFRHRGSQGSQGFKRHSSPPNFKRQYKHKGQGKKSQPQSQ